MAVRAPWWWTLVLRGAEQLCGVTGHCVAIRGPVIVTITVGSVSEELLVYVAVRKGRNITPSERAEEERGSLAIHPSPLLHHLYGY